MIAELEDHVRTDSANTEMLLKLAALDYIDYVSAAGQEKSVPKYLDHVEPELGEERTGQLRDRIGDFAAEIIGTLDIINMLRAN